MKNNTRSRRIACPSPVSSKRIIRATAAAATLSTLSGSNNNNSSLFAASHGCCWASFVTLPVPSRASSSNPYPLSLRLLPETNDHYHQPWQQQQQQQLRMLQNKDIYFRRRQSHPWHIPQSRHFFSQKKNNTNNNNNDDNDNNDWETFKRAGANLLAKGAEKVKSLIPYFGGSSSSSSNRLEEEERRADIIKRERREEIAGGVNSLLRDLPLPFRIMGRMVTPLLAKAADEIAEQSQKTQDVLEEARFRLMNDPYISESLGEPIQVGLPFSQSSSTVVINGQRSATVRASFPVVGPRASGVATLESSNGDIRSLIVNVNGRTLSVGSSSQTRRRGGGKFTTTTINNNSREDNIIEAEIIEKKK